MIIKNTVQTGNPLLRERAKLVTDISSKKVQETIKNLVDTVRYDGFVGEAAPQIGESLRIFVSEVRNTEYRKNEKSDALKIYINPEIISHSEKKVVGYEGCGSVAYAQLFGPVERFERTLIKATDQNGKEFTLKAEGFLARIIQHEYDHLEGILFTDKLTDWTKVMSKEEYIRMKNKGKGN